MIVDCLVHFAKSHPSGWGSPLPQKRKHNWRWDAFLDAYKRSSINWNWGRSQPLPDPVKKKKKENRIHKFSLPPDKQVFVLPSITVNPRQCGLPKPSIHNYARRYTTRACNTNKDSMCRCLLYCVFVFYLKQTWKKNLKLQLQLRIKSK